MDRPIEPARSQSQPAIEQFDYPTGCFRERRSLSTTSYEETLSSRIVEILKGQITLTKIIEAERLLKHIPESKKKMDGSELGTSYSSYSFQTTDFHKIARKAIEVAKGALIKEKFFSEKP